MAGIVCAALLGAGFVACQAPAYSSALPAAGGASSTPQEEGTVWPVLPRQGELRVQGPEGMERQTLSEDDFTGSASWRQLMDYLRSGLKTAPQPGYYLPQSEVLQEAPYEGYRAEPVVIQGNTVEIQCGTGPESSETLYLVTQDKGAAWKWQ